MSKVVHYPECAFCNADNTSHDKVYCQPKYIVSKAGNPCALWYCPNNCKDAETGKYNKIENPFLKNDEIDILVEQGALPTDALAAKKTPTPAPNSALGKRPSPWQGPASNVDVTRPDLQPVKSLRDGLLAFVNQTDSIDALLAISDMINKRISALANK